MLGTIMASFVGVIAARLYTGQSIVRGSSRCDACGAQLQPCSLVPLFSYLAGAGRAQCCHARISPLAPVGELVLGGVFVLGYLRLGTTPELVTLLLALTLLAALVLYDLAHQILPPPLLTVFVMISVAHAWLVAPSLVDLLYVFAVAGAFALFFAALHFFSRGRAMGLADSPLVFGLALLAGSSAVAGLLFSFWIGAGVGILVLARTAPGSRMGVEVPFAPYLATGFLLAYFTQWNPLALIALILSTG